MMLAPHELARIFFAGELDEAPIVSADAFDGCEFLGIAVVYWSGTGNTEAMANLVAEGATSAGAETEVIPCADFSADKAAEYDAFAFGCPAMGSEELEYDEFQPMWDEVKETLDDKKVVLFGSYSWAEGEWMDNWKADADEAGVNVVDSTICYDAPDDESETACKALGAELA